MNSFIRILSIAMVLFWAALAILSIIDGDQTKSVACVGCTAGFTALARTMQEG